MKRAIEEARSEDMKAMADAIKTLADYVRTSFQEFNKRLETHERMLEELARSVGELKVAKGSLGRGWDRDLERTVLELYRHALEERGIEPGKVERFVYMDVDGRYYRPGARLEVDVYIHDDKTYLI